MALTPIVPSPSKKPLPVPPNLTAATRLIFRADVFANLLVVSNTDMLTNIFNQIWNNSDGLSPADACAAFGTNGANFFGFFQLVVDLITQFTGTPPTLIYPSGFSGITANQDGSISPTVSS